MRAQIHVASFLFITLLSLSTFSYSESSDCDEVFSPFSVDEFGDVFDIAMKLYGKNFRTSAILLRCGYKNLALSIIPRGTDAVGEILHESKDKKLLSSLTPAQAVEVYDSARYSLYYYSQGFADGVSTNNEIPKSACNAALEIAAEIMDKRAK